MQKERCLHMLSYPFSEAQIPDFDGIETKTQVLSEISALHNGLSSTKAFCNGPACIHGVRFWAQNAKSVFLLEQSTTNLADQTIAGAQTLNINLLLRKLSGRDAFWFWRYGRDQHKTHQTFFFGFRT